MGNPENQWLEDVSFPLGQFGPIFRCELFQGGYPIFNSKVLGSKRCPSFLNSQKKHVTKNARKINLVVFCWSYFPYFLSTKKTDPNVRRFHLKRISQIFVAVSQVRWVGCFPLMFPQKKSVHPTKKELVQRVIYTPENMTIDYGKTNI